MCRATNDKTALLVSSRSSKNSSIASLVQGTTEALATRRATYCITSTTNSSGTGTITYSICGNPLRGNNNGCGEALRRSQFPLEEDDELLLPSAGGAAGVVPGAVGAPPPGGTCKDTPESLGSTQKLMLPD